MEDKTTLIFISVFVGLFLVGAFHIHDYVYKDLPYSEKTQFFNDKEFFSYANYSE